MMKKGMSGAHSSESFVTLEKTVFEGVLLSICALSYIDQETIPGHDVSQAQSFPSSNDQVDYCRIKFQFVIW